MIAHDLSETNITFKEVFFSDMHVFGDKQIATDMSNVWIWDICISEMQSNIHNLMESLKDPPPCNKFLLKYRKQGHKIGIKLVIKDKAEKV